MNSQQIAEELQLTAQSAVRDVAIGIIVKLLEATPIDTGWAVTNWIMSTGSPWTLTVGTKESISPSVQEASISRIQSYNLRQGKVYISNNVPYIIALNDGSSKQAPSNFIPTAILQALATIRVTRNRVATLR